MATEQPTEHATEQPAEEHRILDHVTSRLAEKFPDVRPAVLHEAVVRALAGVADARIRDFIEIFVHRDARALLRASLTGEATRVSADTAAGTSRHRRRDVLAHAAG